MPFVGTALGGWLAYLLFTFMAVVLCLSVANAKGAAMLTSCLPETRGVDLSCVVQKMHPPRWRAGGLRDGELGSGLDDGVSLLVESTETRM